MLTKVVIGILAATALSAGGYKFYGHISGGSCPLGLCGSKPAATATTPAEPCDMGCCGDVDFNSTEPTREVLSVMPREVQ